MLGRPYSAQCALPRAGRAVGRLFSNPLSQQTIRRRSGPYGYTQAKALVFSQNGEPSDVLK